MMFAAILLTAQEQKHEVQVILRGGESLHGKVVNDLNDAYGETRYVRIDQNDAGYLCAQTVDVTEIAAVRVWSKP
jgi:hypothetical protein